MSFLIRFLIAVLLCFGSFTSEIYAQKKGFEELEVNKKAKKKSFSDLDKNKGHKSTPREKTPTKRQTQPTPQPQQQPQQQHGWTEVRNSGFGEETWYHNPDGSAMVVTRRTCVYCKGAQNCPICFGAKGRYANGMWYWCTDCAGLNGMCKNCRGKGFTISTTFINALGTAISYDEYGRVSLGSGAPKSSSSSSSRDRSSREPEPIDIIQYSPPDYTGEGHVSWCEKCKKWSFPHIHKTVR